MTDHELISKERTCLQTQVVQIVRAAASVTAGLLLTLAIFAVWRRCVGAFQTPLSLATLFSVGAILLAPTLIIRLWWRSLTAAQNISPVEKMWALRLPSLSLLAILTAIAVPGTSVLGIVLVGLLFIMGEAIIYRSRKRLIPVATAGITLDSVEPESGTAILETPTICHEYVEDVYDTSELPAPNVLQKLTRYRTEEGVDCLKGWLRVDIPAGYRAQNVHLAFCPAFEKAPSITVQPEEGSVSCRIKTVQSLPYGAHLEVKLPKPSSHDQTLALSFNASAREFESH